MRADQIEQWIKSPRAQRIKKQIADHKPLTSY